MASYLDTIVLGVEKSYNSMRMLLDTNSVSPFLVEYNLPIAADIRRGDRIEFCEGRITLRNGMYQIDHSSYLSAGIMRGGIEVLSFDAQSMKHRSLT